MTQSNTELGNLARSNKATAYWAGEGVAVVTFYKTHTKLATIKSNDAKVVELGFAMPVNIPASEGVEPKEFTPQERLEAFKGFVIANATAFGIVHDPIDRRPEEYKYPSTYTEPVFVEYGKKALEQAIGEVVTSVQSNVVDKMIKDKNLQEGATVSFAIGDGIASISEQYKSGNIKYATVTFPVTFAVTPALTVDTEPVVINVEVDMISGQLKKPRNLSEKYTMTMTGLKTALVDGKVLPKIEKVVDAPATTTPPAETTPAPQAEGSEEAATA